VQIYQRYRLKNISQNHDVQVVRNNVRERSEVEGIEKSEEEIMLTEL